MQHPESVRSAVRYPGLKSVSALALWRRLRTKSDKHTSRLEREVHRVVSNDNCTGCGVCALISERITISLDTEGFARPEVSALECSKADETEAATFAKVCPGANLEAPPRSDRRSHDVFGSYVDVWQGWARDPEFRRAGASGGVLSVLAEWLVSSGRADAVVGSGMSKELPTLTVAMRITSRDEALASAGSRYAPVVNTLVSTSRSPFIGKPCEVSGRYQLGSAQKLTADQRPIMLSFFCAGTPSQHATDDLVKKCGMDPVDVANLRYRGDGWPGTFQVEATDGRVGAMSYQESWGKNLGRRLQNRCKLCPDGTGEHADIVVGDYWATDAQGFPVFADAEGNSVVIARTRRGAALILSALSQGVVELKSIDLNDVAAVQPLQTSRRRTLAGRLAGRRLAGCRIPRYRGYRLLKNVRHMRGNLKAAAGMFARTTGLR